VVEGVDVYGVCSLSQEVVHFLRGDIALEPVRSINGWTHLGPAQSSRKELRKTQRVVIHFSERGQSR
jgi:hypothetical protein